jgi:methylase of polypeptide subunit release factors
VTRWHPVADRSAARTLGEALRRAGYTEAAVSDLLGDDAYDLSQDDAPVAERRLPEGRLGTVVRAFFLQLAVPTDEVVRALGRDAVDALVATGLADVDEDVAARGRIIPVGELLVASDDFPEPDGDEPPDYVAAYTPTSRLVDALTPRRRLERALDVGTGSGVQALLAARHARNVVATDVNARALTFTEVNAALNGFTNLECRQGSLFEPVAGEMFDLVTSNAPYVISPENRLIYRDAGYEADEFSERIVCNAAEHLNEGGFATLLVSWIAADEDEPDERPLAWTSELGCDSWILPVWGSDPLTHAATWNEELEGDDDAFAAALDEWTEYLERFGAEWVTEGAILLHRRAGGVYTARVDEIDDDVLEAAGTQVERAFEARARLAQLERSVQLLDARLALAMPLNLERELEPQDGRVVTAGGSIELGAGLGVAFDTSAVALEVVPALDGRNTLGEVVEATAARLRLSEADTTRLRRESLSAARELLELGALRLRP